MDPKLISNIKAKTGKPIKDIISALRSSKWNESDALVALGFITQEPANQVTPIENGRIETYVQLGNKLGVILAVTCQSESTISSEIFILFCKNLALHIAAKNPTKEDIGNQNFIAKSSSTVEEVRLEISTHLKDDIQIKDWIRWKI
jgi:elongation factor Ts